MGNYKHASTEAQKIIITFFEKRMKEKKVTQKELAVTLDLSVTTLWRIFNQKTEMSLSVYLEICGALELRPYLIPAEHDNNHMHRIGFN